MIARRALRQAAEGGLGSGGLMRRKITKSSIMSVAPGARDGFLWDTELAGFGLKVTPAGARVYVVQYRAGRRLRRYTIGRHGSPWTPEAARREAARLLGTVAR